MFATICSPEAGKDPVLGQPKFVVVALVITSCDDPGVYVITIEVLLNNCTNLDVVGGFAAQLFPQQLIDTGYVNPATKLVIVIVVFGAVYVNVGVAEIFEVTATEDKYNVPALF